MLTGPLVTSTSYCSLDSFFASEIKITSFCRD
ncbi:hypothetical protein F0L74_31480 [Chitinophaga agrisoli]|uniref:Uncharacterized protein n=1 Tax=Chitinophaga agrisoli TaxID=2607653 RepID=A0A5B2VPP1_9BACT|nr:hypothetical protein F0L74_31480 [Chitinophaga agrisoli]